MAEAMSGASAGRDDQDFVGLIETEPVSTTGEAPAIAENFEYHVMAVENSEYVTALEDSEYVQGRIARRAEVERLWRECETEEEFDTLRTRPTWTEVADSSSSLDGSSAVDQELLLQNQQHFQRLVENNLHRSVDTDTDMNDFSELVFASPFFYDFGERLELGRRIGGGGEADIYEALWDGHRAEKYGSFVLKVFRSGSSLMDLQHHWIEDMESIFTGLNECGIRYSYGCSCVYNGTLLKDGRFAFVLERYWGDLRKLIDLQIMKDNEPHQNPPFPLSLTIWIMYMIAYGMSRLHDNCILHKDLKASNVLLSHGIEDYIQEGKIVLPHRCGHSCVHWNLECDVADFETSKGVMGTGFWRAPEVLHALQNRTCMLNTNIWTKKGDVYNYAMTCYEILTGSIPFQDRAPKDWDGVIKGERPPLPNYIDEEIQDLVKRCWHSEPLMRPTFEEITRELFKFIEKKRELYNSLLSDESDAEAIRWRFLVIIDEEGFPRSRAR